MARDWIAESLRLSLYSSEVIGLSEKDWSVLTGQDEAETRQTVPGGGKRYSGRFGPGQLMLAGFGTRADVILSGLPADQASETMEFSAVGAWDESRDFFVKATEAWLAQLSFPVVRLAFAPILLSETKDVVDSYEVLKGLLQSVQVVPGKMRELIYRINWPQDSKSVPGLTLNRITSWSGIQANVMFLQVGGTEAATMQGPPESFAVRLEMDHNTDQGHKQPFEKQQLLPIYNELVALARENAELGERR
jgi:hypothetical protein